MNHFRQSDDRNVRTFANDFRFSERDGKGFFWDFPLQLIETLVFKEDHRVVIANRLNQQAFGIVRVRGHDTFESRDMGEEGIE